MRGRSSLPAGEEARQPNEVRGFETRNARKVQRKDAKRPSLTVTALNVGTQAAQMAMSGMRFHAHGDRSVWVRIVA